MATKKKEYKKKEEVVKEEPKVEEPTVSSEYEGKIMVKKSPIFKQWKGAPLSEVTHLDSNEVVAVDPNDKRVSVMLKNGNLQFVSNQVRPTPTGEYPRIVED